MNNSVDDRNQQWTQFLEAWPILRMRALSLSEYTSSAANRNPENPEYPFTYWLESLTENLGSIWGGSAMKFGIYRRKDKSDKKSGKVYSYTDEYGWYTKHGATPEEAYKKIKKYLLDVIDNVQKQDLEAIDASPLGDVLSWKVAFLYQDRNNPVVTPIYAAKYLRDTHESFSANTPLSHCHTVLMSEREERNIFSYADELLAEIDEMEEKSKIKNPNINQEIVQNSKTPLNLILYGPPGTGKTWTSSQIAVQICDGSAPTNRIELMARYRELVSVGRIAFTTFHQSMGYEEFVEGLRPTTESGDDDNGSSGGFRLEPRNGIFRQICALAKESGVKSSSSTAFDLTGRQYFKMSLGRANSQNHIYEAALDKDKIAIGYGGEFDWSDPEYDSYEAIKAKWQEFDPSASGNNPNIAQVYNFRGNMKKGDIVIISDGNFKFRAIAEIIGDYEYAEDGVFNDDMIGEGQLYPHQRAVKWHRVLEQSLPYDVIKDGQFSQVSCYNISPDKIKNEALQSFISLADKSMALSNSPEANNFVLIIDEINRANISKVFGELITLLEPDKRIGAGPNSLQVTLPYSGDKFGVPQNLYIVGTMNTADRSIALLDTALRRRFNFVEMMPLYHIEPLDRLVADVHLGNFLKAINERIEWIFDRDHQIGHSFLTSVMTLEDMEQVVREKIIPLLTEYFYEDWEKVCAALNDKTNQFILKEKLIAPEMEGAEEDERYRYRVNPNPFPIEAYQRAYQN